MIQGERIMVVDELDELDAGLAEDLLKMVDALRRRRALLGEDPLHDSVFNQIDEAIRHLEHAAAELLRKENAS
jgi:hypothetical protein